MHRGYVKLWRRVEDTGLLKHPNAFTMFAWMMLRATRLPISKIVCGQTVQLLPGQMIFTRRNAAEDLGITERAVRTAKSVLLNAGIVTHSPTKRFTLITIVKWDTYQANISESDQPDVQPATNNPSIDRPTDDPSTRSKEVKKKKKNKTPSFFEGEFDAFWSAYPRKVSKVDAIKAWEKHRPPLADILTALEWQKNTEQWRKDGGERIPYPASYLNGKRWMDEPPTPLAEDGPDADIIIATYFEKCKRQEELEKKGRENEQSPS